MVARDTRPGRSLTLTVDLDNPTVPPDQLLKRCVCAARERVCSRASTLVRLALGILPPC